MMGNFIPAPEMAPSRNSSQGYYTAGNESPGFPNHEIKNPNLFQNFNRSQKDQWLS